MTFEITFYVSVIVFIIQGLLVIKIMKDNKELTRNNQKLTKINAETLDIAQQTNKTNNGLIILSENIQNVNTELLAQLNRVNVLMKDHGVQRRNLIESMKASPFPTPQSIQALNIMKEIEEEILDS